MEITTSTSTHSSRILIPSSFLEIYSWPPCTPSNPSESVPMWLYRSPPITRNSLSGLFDSKFSILPWNISFSLASLPTWDEEPSMMTPRHICIRKWSNIMVYVTLLTHLLTTNTRIHSTISFPKECACFLFSLNNSCRSYLFILGLFVTAKKLSAAFQRLINIKILGF